MSVMVNPFLSGASGAGSGIVYVGGKVDSRATTTGSWVVSLSGLSGGIASSPAAGDLVVVVFGQSAAGDFNMILNTGYTEVIDLWSADSSEINLGVYHKIMGGTPDTDCTATVNATSGVTAAMIIQVWRGVNATTPMDVTPTATGSNNGSVANPPSITPVTPGAVVIGIGAAGSAFNSGIIYTSSDLSNFLHIEQVWVQSRPGYPELWILPPSARLWQVRTLKVGSRCHWLYGQHKGLM